MLEDKTTFRVVSFGGFHKEDVIKYLEEIDYKIKQITEKSNIENSKLRGELDLYNHFLDKQGMTKDELFASFEQGINSNEEFQTVLEEKERLAKEVLSLEQENEQLTNMVRSHKNSSNEQILEMTKENQSLKDKIAALESENRQFSNVKETLVKLELDAHIRAKNVESEATLKAKSVVDVAKREAESILLNAMSEKEAIVASNKKVVDKAKAEVLELISSTCDISQKIHEHIENIANQNQSIKEKMLNIESELLDQSIFDEEVELVVE